MTRAGFGYPQTMTTRLKRSEGLWGGCEEKKAADLVMDQSPLKEYGFQLKNIHFCLQNYTKDL